MEVGVELELRWKQDALRQALGRIGVWSNALGAQAAIDERAAAGEIEGLGFGAIWFGEGLEAREAFSHAGWLLASTERAVIATGIANIWARDPVAMANGWRMLTDAYPDRFLLGLGVSHAAVVDRRGGTYARPALAMRDYLAAMDLASSTAPEPEAYPRRVLAALGPKMLGLAAEAALGAHPYFVPVEHTAFARRRLGPGPVLAVEQTVVVSSEPSEARAAARRFAAWYLRSPSYTSNLKRMGWTDADVSGEGSDAMIDAVVAWGNVDRIVSRVRQHLEAGADHVCVQVVSRENGAMGMDELRELAPALLEL